MDKRLNIGLVFIVNHMDFGGCQKIVYDLIKGVHKNFSSVYLIAEKGYYSNLLINTTPVFFLDRSGKSIIHTFRTIREIQKKHENVILHSHNRVDIVFKFCLRKRDSHIHTFHSSYLNKNYLYRLIKPERAISISNTVKTYLDKYGIKNQMIYNGIELRDEKYNKRSEKLNNPKILFIGRVTKAKGFDSLLKGLLTFSLKYLEFGNLQLDVVGDGKKVEHYSKQVLDSKSQLKVNFKGFLANPWMDINNYDLLVIPSYFEGFCLVAAEGASIGIPVIGNNISALREILDFLPESNFFDIHNQNSIHETILNCLNNLQNQKRIASNNVDLIKNRFSKEKMIMKYMEVYESTY